MSASPRNSVETPRKLQSDGFLGTGKKNSKDGLREALLASQTKEIRIITKNKYASESSDLGYASKHSLDSFMANNHDGNYSRRISTTSLADFDPKPLREFFSLKQPQIRVMVMKDNFEEPAVYNVRLMDLHESLTTYVRSVHTPGRGSESSPIGLVSTPIKSDFHSTDFEKILELRGRDLFCIAKPAGEVDIPVVIIRQHLCVICARYDMRAIIQDDRIIFIGQSPEDDFEDIKRHMQGNIYMHTYIMIISFYFVLLYLYHIELLFNMILFSVLTTIGQVPRKQRRHIHRS